MWLLALGAAALLAARPGGERELANFTTSLVGRTPAQQHNARLAAAAVNGTVVAPGGEFSFNRSVGQWTRDRGYLRAPASFGGEMVLAYGGGVCQVSSTLYNAALLAGMSITARDHHAWEPHYVPAGRDAAVAQGIADLCFVNPLPEPVTVCLEVRDERLEASLLSTAVTDVRYALEIEPVELAAGPPIVEFDRHLSADSTRRVRPGSPGRRVRVWRLAYAGNALRNRELVSDDRYLALSPVTRVGPGL